MGVPSFQQAGSTLFMSNVNVQVQYNLTSGRADFYWQNSKKIAGFYAGVGLAQYLTDTVYGSHAWSVLRSNEVVVTSTNVGLPTMNQYFELNQNDSFLTWAAVQSAGTNSNWMSPLVMDTAGGVDIGSYNDVRALIVPWDNNSYSYTYNGMSINNTNYSYEVGAFYDNTTRTGLVVGSVTHDQWKTGIYFQGANNKLNIMNVYGGLAWGNAFEGADVLPHGAVAGTNISSPIVFVGFGADWRTVMEAYANANTAQVPALPWQGGVPFGWNSWYAYGTSVSYSNATAVATFIKNNLQTNQFNDQGTVYINLDSYWSNLSDSQLQQFASNCHANGQKAGIYWTPFVYWGTASQGSNSTMTGSSYLWSAAYLRTPSGSVQSPNNQGIALDPTHPGVQQMIAYYINYFTGYSYDYLKLDFLTHGALEGAHYATNVTTGIQAYNQGMQYLLQQNNGRMFLSESIAPVFPYQYAHSRRIACDTATTISQTAFELNGVTYGWWISGRLYAYNDPDMMKFAGGTANENQSRLISGAISGTVFLDSDDLASSTGQTLALTCLTNAALNAVARLGQTFRPVEGNTGTNATDEFVLQNGTNWYLAVLNYSASATNESVDFTRAGIPSSTCGALDLWSGAFYNANGSLSVSLAAKQSKLFQLVNVPTAILTPSPSLQSITNGGAASFTINLAVSGCFTDTLAFSVVGLPARAGASFTPASLSGAGASTLTVTTSNSTPPGNYTLTITGQGATLTNTTTVNLVITRATPANLRWNSSSSSVWDISTIPNWLNFATDTNDVFLPGDTVLFDDTPGVVTGITIGSGVAVTPSALTNNSSVNDFTIFGAGEISGGLSLVKLGSSTLTLSTANSFTGAVSILQGTLREGIASALGASNTTVIITNTGVLDLNGYGLGVQPVIVSGSGPGGGGAIVNSGGPAYDNGNALNAVTLAADASFGGPTRWDLGGSSGGVLSTGGQPWNVTLAGAAAGIYYEWMNLTADASLANINVLPGATLGDKGSTALGNPTNSVIVSSNASLTFYNSGGNNVTLSKKVILADGATMQNGGGANTALQPVTLSTNAAGAPGNCTFEIGSTSLTLSNALTGPGNLIKTGSSPLKLAAANTFTGSLILSNGTVALLGAGAVSNCAAIVLGAGTTLDVSGRADKTLTLAAGQTLQGYGTVDGSLTVDVGATVAPGGPVNLGALIATNAILLMGTTMMKLNKAAATNDVIGGAASLAYGGTLAVTNLAGTLGPGDSFKLFSATSFLPSAFATINPPSLGPGLAWNTTTLTNDGTLRIAGPLSFAGITATATMLTLRGTNGVPDGSCRLLASTNLALPKTNWVQVGAGSFDGNGAFTLTVTNNPAEPLQFYLLVAP